MKIAIDSRSINLHSGTGIGTYTKNLVSELINIKSPNKYSLIWTGSDNKNDFSKENTELIISSGKHNRFFENHYIPSSLISSNIDLYHIPQNGLGFPFEFENLNTVVTIHDLIPYTMPETVGSGYLNRFLKDMPYIIENAKGILTVSEYSKRDILKFFKGYPEDKIFVTPLAANKNFKPLNKENCLKLIQKKFNFSGRYILYIGGFSSRKNVQGLIDSFNLAKTDLPSDYKLLIVGSLKDEGENLLEYAKESTYSKDIIFSGFIDNNLLPVIYNGAKLFVYPSFYEGFGLPPLEAMSCKTPVITSDITSIPEVTKDSALLCNPSDIHLISKSIVNILTDENLYANLSLKGYENSLQFSWRQTAMKTLEAYSSIASSLN